MSQRLATVKKSPTSTTPVLCLAKAIPEAIRDREIRRLKGETVEEAILIKNLTKKEDVAKDIGQWLLREVPPRPALTSVLFRRRGQQGPALGIDFTSFFSEIKIQKIHEECPIKNAPIRPGDLLIRIDLQDVDDSWTPAQVTDYVKMKAGPNCLIFRAPNGVDGILAAFFQARKRENLGLKFLKFHDGQFYRHKIGAIAVDGLMNFHSPVLRAGDLIEYVNSLDVSNLDFYDNSDAKVFDIGWTIEDMKRDCTLIVSRDTTQLFKRSEIRNSVVGTRDENKRPVRRTSVEDETVIAHEHATMDFGSAQRRYELELPIKRPAFISISMPRAANDYLVGSGVSFSHSDSSQHRLAIAKMNEERLSCPLRPGMVLLSINQRYAFNWDEVEASGEILRASQPILFVQDRTGDPSYASATVVKATPASPLGVAFTSTNGSLEVKKLWRGGDSVFSAIEGGDHVISINNIPCDSMSPDDAIGLTKTEIVTILVRKLETNGIVLGRLSEKQKLIPVVPVLQQKHDEWVLKSDHGSDQSDDEKFPEIRGCCCCIAVLVIILMSILEDPREEGIA